MHRRSCALPSINNDHNLRQIMTTTLNKMTKNARQLQQLARRLKPNSCYCLVLGCRLDWLGFKALSAKINSLVKSLISVRQFKILRNMCESWDLGKYCFQLCSYLVQVYKMCSTVKTHLQHSHVGAGSRHRQLPDDSWTNQLVKTWFADWSLCRDIGLKRDRNLELDYRSKGSFAYKLHCSLLQPETIMDLLRSKSSRWI